MVEYSSYIMFSMPFVNFCFFTCRAFQITAFENLNYIVYKNIYILKYGELDCTKGSPHDGDANNTNEHVVTSSKRAVSGFQSTGIL